MAAIAETPERALPVLPRTYGLMRRLRETYAHTYTACTVFVSIGGFIFGFDTGIVLTVQAILL